MRCLCNEAFIGSLVNPNDESIRISFLMADWNYINPALSTKRVFMLLWIHVATYDHGHGQSCNVVSLGSISPSQKSWIAETGAEVALSKRDLIDPTCGVKRTWHRHQLSNGQVAVMAPAMKQKKKHGKPLQRSAVPFRPSRQDGPPVELRPGRACFEKSPPHGSSDMMRYRRYRCKSVLALTKTLSSWSCVMCFYKQIITCYHITGLIRTFRHFAKALHPLSRCLLIFWSLLISFLYKADPSCTSRPTSTTEVNVTMNIWMNLWRTS